MCRLFFGGLLGRRPKLARWPFMVFWTSRNSICSWSPVGLLDAWETPFVAPQVASHLIGNMYLGNIWIPRMLPPPLALSIPISNGWLIPDGFFSGSNGAPTREASLSNPDRIFSSWELWHIPWVQMTTCTHSYTHIPLILTNYAHTITSRISARINQCTKKTIPATHAISCHLMPCLRVLHVTRRPVRPPCDVITPIWSTVMCPIQGYPPIVNISIDNCHLSLNYPLVI